MRLFTQSVGACKCNDTMLLLQKSGKFHLTVKVRLFKFATLTNKKLFAQNSQGLQMPEELCMFFALELMEMLSALQYSGIVHSRISPENLVLRYEECVLCNLSAKFSQKPSHNNIFARLLAFPGFYKRKSF